MIEVTQSQMQTLREKFPQVTQILKNLGYEEVLINPEPRKPSV